ncbi:amino acid ABC transporter substrate-binding protein [Pleurocapsa sp. PCC 7319]|uniref:amino acid ABC transporter substrate-binding protein n=1 Tax=Pleurocapsa sp. PCC 7319 TaxID=118161 RepID=UPI00034B3578|nr:amino acid ABC transporter substrate-binding protein [Pleurocapsa sp. PCC 7319]
MNRQIRLFLINSLLIFGLSSPVNAETVLEQIQRTGILRIAIREDAAPFGYLDDNGKLQGYCLDFFALLRQRLISNLERNTLSIKLLKSNSRNRFTLVRNNIVDLECGPNTIRSDIPEQTSFSDVFFVTGTQFLIKKNNRVNLKIQQNLAKIQPDLADLRIGVIGNTTTEEFIKDRYPSATLLKLSGVTGRVRGIQAVRQGRIDAMVSDGILLRAEAQQLGLSATEYPLIPETPLTCDRYGMIIKGQDSQWQDFINSVINSSAATELYNSWFGRLFSYTQAAEDFCDLEKLP